MSSQMTLLDRANSVLGGLNYLSIGSRGRLSLVLGMLPLFAACASLNPENMVTENAELDTHHQVSVALEVGKASKGEGWYSGSVRAEQLEKAIRASIRKTGLFSNITTGASANYLLDVRVTYAGSHPGFNMNAWVKADWKLIDSATGDTVWSKSIKGRGHATLGEALSGNKRQMIALERAGKANIDEALAEMARLDL